MMSWFNLDVMTYSQEDCKVGYSQELLNKRPNTHLLTLSRSRTRTQSRSCVRNLDKHHQYPSCTDSLWMSSYRYTLSCTGERNRGTTTRRVHTPTTRMSQFPIDSWIFPWTLDISNLKTTQLHVWYQISCKQGKY